MLCGQRQRSADDLGDVKSHKYVFVAEMIPSAGPNHHRQSELPSLSL